MKEEPHDDEEEEEEWGWGNEGEEEEEWIDEMVEATGTTLYLYIVCCIIPCMCFLLSLYMISMLMLQTTEEEEPRDDDDEVVVTGLAMVCFQWGCIVMSSMWFPFVTLVLFIPMIMR